jgi:hypothetical protein
MEEEDGAHQQRGRDRTRYESTFHYQYLQDIRGQVLTQIASGQPECYENNTFWIRSPVPVFDLDDAVVVDPLHWCQPDVFVWLPRQFQPRPTLKCPHCSSEHINIKDYPHPRKVVDLDRCYYILTSRHECQGERCGSMFVKLYVTKLHSHSFFLSRNIQRNPP